MSKELKVLVIEDDDNIRRNLVMYLEDSEYGVIEATNGKSGVEKFFNEDPDIVVTDLYMPEMDGFGVIEAIKKERPDFPIIVSSGAGEIGAAIKATKLGASDFLLKPIVDMSIVTHSICKAYERVVLIKENLEYKKGLEREVENSSIANKKLEESLVKLEKSKNQLIMQKKLAALGAVTSKVAHELQNPLNFVINFSEGLEQMIEDLQEKVDLLDGGKDLNGDFSATVEAVNLIVENGNRMSSIIRNMLSHSVEGIEKINRLDLDLFVNEHLDIALDCMITNKPEFKVNIKNELNSNMKIDLYPQSLGRALNAIFINAFGEMAEKLKAAQVEYTPVLTITSSSQSESIEIKVRDNGNGIPEEIRESIFDPFFSTKPSGISTGLGLSVANNVVTELHQGKIAVLSKVGEYSEFIIELPQVQQKREAL